MIPSSSGPRLKYNLSLRKDISLHGRATDGSRVHVDSDGSVLHTGMWGAARVRITSSWKQPAEDGTRTPGNSSRAPQCSDVDTPPRFTVDCAFYIACAGLHHCWLKASLNLTLGEFPIWQSKSHFDTDRIPESSGRRRYSTCHLCPPVKCGLRIHTWCRGAGPRSARAGWSPACNPSGPVPPFLGSAPCTACKGDTGSMYGADSLPRNTDSCPGNDDFGRETGKSEHKDLHFGLCLELKCEKILKQTGKKTFQDWKLILLESWSRDSEGGGGGGGFDEARALSGVCACLCLCAVRRGQGNNQSWPKVAWLSRKERQKDSLHAKSGMFPGGEGGGSMGSWVNLLPWEGAIVCDRQSRMEELIKRPQVWDCHGERRVSEHSPVPDRRHALPSLFSSWCRTWALRSQEPFMLRRPRTGGASLWTLRESHEAQRSFQEAGVLFH